jgi:hypothetical protein
MAAPAAVTGGLQRVLPWLVNQPPPLLLLLLLL